MPFENGVMLPAKPPPTRSSSEPPTSELVAERTPDTPARPCPNVTAPALRFYYGGNGLTTRLLGVGQLDRTVDYVQLPNVISSPVSSC